MAPEKPKPPLFFISGISYAVSVILITLIAISLISIVFMFGNTYLQSQSRQEKITILDADIFKMSSSIIVRFSIGNTGTEQARLNSISLESVACQKTYNQNILPGQRFSDTFTCNVNLNIGSKIVLKASATTPSGKNIGDAVWVVVSA